MRAWLHRDKLPELENVRAWLFKIAAREYLTHVRNNLTRSVQTTPLEKDGNATALPSQYHDGLSLKEMARLIAEAAESLSPQRKTVFRLSRQEHLTVKEVAAQLHLSEKTVKNTLTAALSEIRNHLAAFGYRLPLLYILSAFFS